MGKRAALLVAMPLSCMLGVALTACTIASAPVVSSVFPADHSGNVPFSSTIKAVFSMPMDPATLTTSSFVVQIGGAPVAGTVTCSGTTATFTPTSLLPGDSLVTAAVTTDARGLSGTPVTAERSWTFMTVPLLTAANSVLYYAYTFGTNKWTRSPSPVTMTAGSNTLSQSYIPADGSVTLTISNATGYEDNGFYFYVGTLRFFTSLKVTADPGSGPFSANIYFDADNNGEYFVWSPPNVYSSAGSDLYYSSPPSVNGALTIDNSTTFGGHTLPDFRAGAVAGITPDTRVAVYLGISTGPLTQTTTIRTVKVN